MTLLLFTLLGVNVIALIAVIVMYRKARKAQRRRVVERPNSQYKSRYVEDLESKEQWENLNLTSLHEVNREEAVKILAKLRSTSTRGLNSYEKAFLDRMVESERRREKEERRTSRRSDSHHGQSPRPVAG